jgi:hypothetical protein
MRSLFSPRVVGSAACLVALGAAGVFALGQASARTTALPPVDHFKCYLASQANPFPYAAPAVRLDDQFGKTFNGVQGVNLLCNPVQKSIPGANFPPQHPNLHLICHAISSQPTTAAPPSVQVSVQNQFGTARLTVRRPATRVCIPSLKTTEAPPDAKPITVPGLDHFKCYTAAYSLDVQGKPIKAFESIPPPGATQLVDQFGGTQASFGAPAVLCAPAAKWIDPAGPPTKVQYPGWHLVCLRMAPASPPTIPPTLYGRNQFGAQIVRPQSPGVYLCLPSLKQIVTG